MSLAAITTTCVLGFVLAGGLLGWVGCSPEDDFPGCPPVGTAPIQPRGPCPLAKRVGGFLVEVQKDYSLIDGKVADGMVPASIPELVWKDGPCELLRRRSPVCVPPCQPRETCDYDGRCIPYPTQQDVGVVCLSGLHKAVVLRPMQPGNSYFDSDLPHPIFEPGAEVRLRSTAGRYGELGLEGRGQETLRLGSPEWVVDRDQDLPIHWDPPTLDASSEIQLILRIDQHGKSPLGLSCRLPDTGEFTIPASVLNALLDAGVTGFPNGKLVRQTVDSIEIEPGCVELVVSCPANPKVRVAGFIPCKKDSECPSGLTCDKAIELCR